MVGLSHQAPFFILVFVPPRHPSSPRLLCATRTRIRDQKSPSRIDGSHGSSTPGAHGQPLSEGQDKSQGRAGKDQSLATCAAAERIGVREQGSGLTLNPLLAAEVD
jgi:hypothetical protein